MQIVEPETQGFSSHRLARIRPVMQAYVQQKKLAGIQTLIARRGEVVHFENVGMQDVKQARPMADNTIFRIYSMTKPITSTAAMMLFEEGRFRLSDPISAYLPEFRNMQVIRGKTENGVTLEPAQREITILDLFTHTAGMSYGFDPHDYLDQRYAEEVWKALEKKRKPTLTDFVRAAASLPLRFHPGTQFHYSVSVDILGAFVEVISGQPFNVFLREKIFEPLRMPDTDFSTPADKVARLSAVYGPGDRGGIKEIESVKNSPFARPRTLFSGGGGLVSTSADYLRFCQMILNGGALDGERLLGRKTVEFMQLNHLPSSAPTIDNPAQGFGLGGAVLTDGAHFAQLGSLGTWEWGGAANTAFWIDPREQLIAILMLQYMPAWLVPVAADFRTLVYQALVD